MNELGGSIEDISKIEGILLLKQQEADKKQKLLDAFDFRNQDKTRTKQLVDEIDERIAMLNAERYSLNQRRKKILSSLEEDQILFSPDEADRLFKDAGVLFKDQIKKDFVQLISFNKAITDERRGYLQEERVEVEAELKRVNPELNALGKRRSETLAFLSVTDVFSRYKQVADEMVRLRADSRRLKGSEASCGDYRSFAPKFALSWKVAINCNRRSKRMSNNKIPIRKACSQPFGSSSTTLSKR
jgi:uncharacterized protein YydD (DUF2326 family)